MCVVCCMQDKLNTDPLCTSCKAPGIDLCDKATGHYLLVPYAGLIQAICLVVPSVLSLLLLLSVSNGEEITPLFDDIELGEEGGQRHDHSKKHKTSDTKRSAASIMAWSGDHDSPRDRQQGSSARAAAGAAADKAAAALITSPGDVHPTVHANALQHFKQSLYNKQQSSKQAAHLAVRIPPTGMQDTNNITAQPRASSNTYAQPKMPSLLQAIQPRVHYDDDDDEEQDEQEPVVAAKPKVKSKKKKATLPKARYSQDEQAEYYEGANNAKGGYYEEMVDGQQQEGGQYEGGEGYQQDGGYYDNGGNNEEGVQEEAAVARKKKGGKKKKKPKGEAAIVDEEY
eukprot:jgi/Chrzof1/14231/Cz08g30130.t1